ncbi:glycosyltransferase family 2 protein [archaeon]|jgi:cellulose synthase/poly-beta-1,6-N-acetylglucosamine synthase-like glycosyltransferase|nr:glycosyltransferase family 2 protein [archaeon]MBT4023053.1 glycosyltransferase family 2 protein [archaeon]MBT4272452.1 glycosyltransferase family 2 protein [archaeon]MBT4460550.1 glycosyltransferase family 2 protein [archaeon]MBT4857860.1 glycosyltransferase family 2 protein [archaeon]
MELIQKLMIYVVWFISTYFVILFILLVLKYRNQLFEKKPQIKSNFPLVSVIVPAYNEEENIISTLKSLKKIDYPKLEFIIINDGSKDQTSKKITEYLKKGSKNIRFIDNFKNQGKSAVLNQGIKISKGEFVVCMDADTVVLPNVLKRTLPEFSHEKVGAVTVSIDLKPKNLLQKITEIEYAVGLSLSIGILCKLDSAHVTPGPFTVFRKSMFDEIGGFDEKNITEDSEIAYRMQKYGYKIRCCLTTKVYTEVPRNFKGLYKQRRRWYTGALQTLSKHRDIIFNKKLGIFGYFIPLNYAVVLLGVIVFILSSILSINNLIKDISFYRLIDFNFLQILKQVEIDLLSFFSLFGLLILTSFILTAVLAFVGLRIINKDIKKRLIGYIGFLPFFILYQVFWISSIFNFIFKREFEWK